MELHTQFKPFLSRERAIQELLNRSFGIRVFSTHEHMADLERFLEQDFNIPPAWIYKAKVIFSRYNCRKDMELKSLMLANDLNAAFDVFINHMAVNMILEGTIDNVD